MFGNKAVNILEVESTARFAYEYGYAQVFAEDAMAAMSAEEHAATVAKVFPRIGLVRKTAEILARVRTGPPTGFIVNNSGMAAVRTPRAF
jgi:isochorismate hydrolase